jgi:serine/threonine protein kinase
VLLVALPDGSERILKVGAPTPKGRESPFVNEYVAYSALLHHKISRPPGESTEPRVVPYCYGFVALRDLREQMRCASDWKSPIKKHLSKRPLCALLLEYIPNSVSIAADPARLSNRPHLVTDILNALRIVHSAGVYHNDIMPRNVLLDENDGVWWIDFGWSRNTSMSQIHDAWYQRELRHVEVLLLEDVIPAERKGIVPGWRRLGQ